MIMANFIKVEDRRPGWKAPILLGWTGMRGVVSLAAALSIPVALSSGAAFPNRDLILFITFTVIIVTLVLQGLTLPLLVKWVNMPDPDYTISFEQQKQLVRKKLSALSLKILKEKYSDQLVDNDIIKSLQLKLNADMGLLRDWEKENNRERADAFYKDYRLIMADLMEQQRDLLANLNKKENISDELIRQQLELLDLEEEKLRQHFAYDEV
jgi:NhaP-type Na+/H+ or K+/H+ antiporter